MSVGCGKEPGYREETHMDRGRTNAEYAPVAGDQTCEVRVSPALTLIPIEVKSPFHLTSFNLQLKPVNLSNAKITKSELDSATR